MLVWNQMQNFNILAFTINIFSSEDSKYIIYSSKISKTAPHLNIQSKFQMFNSDDIRSQVIIIQIIM